MSSHQSLYFPHVGVNINNCIVRVTHEGLVVLPDVIKALETLSQSCQLFAFQIVNEQYHIHQLEAFLKQNILDSIISHERYNISLDSNVVKANFIHHPYDYVIFYDPQIKTLCVERNILKSKGVSKENIQFKNWQEIIEFINQNSLATA